MDSMTPVGPAAGTLRLQALWRRTLFFGLTLLTALTGGFLMLDILRANGPTPLELLALPLFMVLFGWIAGAFWTAIAGFMVLLAGRDHAILDPRPLAGRPLHGRTAVVVPIHNEDTVQVFAGMEATWSSLRLEPQAAHFDLFILSDTRKSGIAMAEERAWQAMLARHGAAARLFYRRRSENTGRKAGNLADFVRNWGAAYDYMIVLDADSVMSGHALVSLAQLMDAHPEVGIVQALPLLAGRETLFARLLQFAVRLSGPMFASGLTFWQLGDGNYWGHNAIVRLAPFAEHCGLPRLPGKPPFGGEILSHDIVEAAFMRRANYQIWLVPDIAGSWEEIPSNVIDYAARDRRWAQGNLQHLGVLPIRGLHWLSRIHMLTGILSYVSSPLWLLVLILSSIVTCLEAVTGHHYFQPGTYTLFPTWPRYRDGEIAALLAMTITMLTLPKLLGAVLTLRNPAQRAAFGGAGRLLRSVLLEQLLSMLMAPIMMLFHSEFVLRALLGRSVGWDAQARGDRGVSWSEALRRHRSHLIIGLLWGSTILALAPDFVGWLLPVILGMLLAVPFTVLTSRVDLGRALRRRGWLLTPEETAPPPELAAAAAAMVQMAAGAAADLSAPEPAARALPASGSARDEGPAPQRLPQQAPLPMGDHAATYWPRRDVARRRAANAPR